MSEEGQKNCAGCFRILADETRLKILRELQGKCTNVADLTDSTGVTQPTVSYHLKMLGTLGLVTSERRGRETYYAFNPEYPCRGCGVFSLNIKLAK